MHVPSHTGPWYTLRAGFQFCVLDLGLLRGVQIFSKSVTAAAVAVTGEPDEFEKIALKVCFSFGSIGR